MMRVELRKKYYNGEQVKEVIEEFVTEYDDILGALNRFASMETDDVRPVVHGKWELAEDGWYCSVCELYPPFDCDPEEKGIPFCPYCGADMREVENDEGSDTTE